MLPNTTEKKGEKKDKELNQIQDEMDNITHTVGKSNTVHKSSLKEALLLWHLWHCQPELLLYNNIGPIAP